MTTQERAKQITDFLFTSGTGQKAARLVLTDDSGKDMGGWSERAAVRWIAKFLDAAPDAIKANPPIVE